ncbi:MAG TPA: FecR domain-containing protein, partial [Caulobacteraceae bacterium]|nr:FecR domain-containing protein [Caulobacteraceae bacterium]
HRTAYEEVAYVYALSDEHAAATSIMSLRRAALASEARRAPAWSVAAAGLAAAVALGWVGLAGVSNAPTASPSVVTRMAEALGARADPGSAVYRTRVGERLTFNLPDGSVATLNTNSVLKVAYEDGERGVRLLRGQALFEVAKNRQAPFRVYAGDRQITAVGTVFDVRLDGGKVKVALVEGAVRVAPVKPAASPGPLQQVELTAGEVMEAEKAAPMLVATADVERAVTWKSGIVEFAGEPLAEAVAEMNRYTDRPIRIADPSIAGLRVSGVFRTGEPELFVRMVSEVVPVTAERGPNGSTVLRGRNG